MKKIIGFLFSIAGPLTKLTRIAALRAAILSIMSSALFSVAFTAHAGLSRLEAISMIETGNNDRARGCAGEVSRYQLLPRVWRCYTNSLAYQDPDVSAWVARQHLNYLESWFYRQTGRPVTDFELYVLWNAGPAYFAKKSFRDAAVNPIIRERAGRFVNLRAANETNLQYVIHDAAR